MRPDRLAMVQGGGRVRRGARALRGKSGEELGAMFSSWVDLPADFGGGKRRRLFFPRAGVLAVSLAGAFGGSCLP